ncbi:MAG: hypothetical protein ACO28Q_09800 [Ilumatobacteraceae bacterium]
MARTATSSVFDAVIGQDDAVAKLRALSASPAHAYLFVGPSGCGKEAAARAFAAVRLQGDENAGGRIADLVMRGIHVDVHELEREGASIDVEQAREEIVKLADRTAVEGSTRVIIVHEFHLLADIARSALLKTIEEPDGQTIIVMLADEVPDTFATIASRSVRVNFGPVSDELVAATLIAEGCESDVADEVARVAAGDLDRARVLVGDPKLSERMRLFTAIPQRLDGSLSAAIALVADISAAIEEALEPYKAKQGQELATLEERAKLLGERGSGRRTLTERHKRELRRFRTDELRSGLRALSIVYRDAMSGLTDEAAPHEVIGYADAVSSIRRASNALTRNVNERLLLEELFMSLPSIRR